MAEVIEQECETCGTHFFVKPYRIKEGTGRFCSLKCYFNSPEAIERTRKLGQRERTPEQAAAAAETMAKAVRGKHFTPEHCRKIAESHMGQSRPSLAEFDHKRSAAGGYNGAANPNFGKHLTPEIKEKISQKRQAYFARTPLDMRRLSPETRAKLSATRKLQWQDPAYVAKLIKAMGVSPNKVETRLMRILQPALPEFKYNGDYGQGINIDGLIPDFINADERYIIEVFGRYWHSRKVVGDDVRRTAEGKLAIYHSLGYKCLVLWDDEMAKQSDADILESVLRFF